MSLQTKWKSETTLGKKRVETNNFDALACPVPTPSKQENERRSKPGSCGIFLSWPIVILTVPLPEARSPTTSHARINKRGMLRKSTIGPFCIPTTKNTEELDRLAPESRNRTKSKPHHPWAIAVRHFINSPGQTPGSVCSYRAGSGLDEVVQLNDGTRHGGMEALFSQFRHD